MENSLEKLFPEIAREWDFEKNAPLRPDSVGHGSTKKVYWICSRGHSYQARIDHRTIMHSGCPYCSGKRPVPGENDLKTIYPDIAAEWDYSRNEKGPEQYLPRSNTPVYWKCAYCGFSYKKQIDARTLSMTGCPNCLKERGTSFQEQSILFYLSKMTCSIGRYKEFGKEIDVFIPSLNTGIEYDGRFFHKNRRSRDSEKRKYLESKGIRLILIKEGDVNRSEKDSIEIKSTDTGYVAVKDLEWGIRELFRMLDFDCPDIDLGRDQIRIKEQYIISLKKDNFAQVHPELAAMWDGEKNGRLKPENITCGSNHKAYFDCPVCGTVYLRKISEITGGMGCPVCAGKQIKKGYNDLATTHPRLAAEWHERNDLKADEVTRGSDRKAWWRCGKCGYEWKAAVSSRALEGVGCPVCAGRQVIPGRNDLETLYPEIAAEWDELKNGTDRPSGFRPGSNRVFWWRCGKCGHEWRTSAAARVRGRGCPACGRRSARDERIKTYIKMHGSLAEIFPDIAKEWDPEKNGGLTPNTVSPGSSQKVWWICGTCGNSWQAVISSRTLNGNGCPECGKKKCVVTAQLQRIELKGSLAETRPDLALQWDYEANGTLTPQDVTAGSKKRVGWICPKGHRWKAVVYSRKKAGCPYCAGRKAASDETGEVQKP